MVRLDSLMEMQSKRSIAFHLLFPIEGNSLQEVLVHVHSVSLSDDNCQTRSTSVVNTSLQRKYCSQTDQAPGLLIQRRRLLRREYLR